MHLVVGGAGFIGSNLADRLLSDGEAVTVLDNFSRLGARQNLDWLQTRHPSVAVVEANIQRDQETLAEVVARSQTVYHLAAQVAVTTSVADPVGDFETNARGTLNVLEAVRLSNPEAVVVYASTNKVYGALESVPIVEHDTRFDFADGSPGISEQQPLDLHSPYGCSKGAGDQYTRDYARTYGIRTVVLRQSCIYGPRQFGIEDQGWLAWFAIAALLGRPVTVYGTGKQVRDLLDISDLIELLRLVAKLSDKSQGQIYNAGGGRSRTLSVLEALALLEEELNTSIDIRFDAARPGDQTIFVADTRKAETELGWRPRVDLEQGVQRLVEWIASNRDLFVSASAHSPS